jgi:hypothetical protein
MTQATYTVTTTKDDLAHGAAWVNVATFEYESEDEKTETYTVTGDNAALIEHMLNTDSAVISYISHI